MVTDACGRRCDSARILGLSVLSPFSFEIATVRRSALAQTSFGWTSEVLNCVANRQWELYRTAHDLQGFIQREHHVSKQDVQQMDDPISEDALSKMNAMLENHHVNLDQLITDKLPELRRKAEAKVRCMEDIELKFAQLEQELAEYNNAVSVFFKSNQGKS